MENREIKFRAWDCKNQKWVYYFAGESLPGNCDDNSLNNWEFTGIKDKNGKDIYEGDILKIVVSYDSDKTETNDIVIFKNASFCTIEIKKYKDNYPDWSVLDNYLYHEFEIIGNIYENPDLLNK